MGCKVRFTVAITFAVLVSLLLPLQQAQASDPDEDDILGPLDDETAPTTEPTAEASSAALAPAPPPADRSWSFGPYLRYVVVPAFMLELFLDLAPTTGNAAFGATARYRSKDGSAGFELGLGYASYAFQGPFRTKGGELNDTEWVESSLGLVHVTGSVVWETQLSSQFAFEYGVGLDFGIVTGEFKRTEAYQGADGLFGKCPGPLTNPLCRPALTPGAFSDPPSVKGEQYNVIDDGVPPVIGLPMLPRLALRYEPIPDLAVRVEGAYGIAQVWFGISAAYAPAL